MPGDGRRPIHEETRRWGQEFKCEGNPDFQTDERWWQAVLEHEEIKNKGKQAKTEASVPSQADEQAVPGRPRRARRRARVRHHARGHPGSRPGGGWRRPPPW